MTFEDVDWASIPGPPSYQPGKVPEALTGVAKATSKTDAHSAYQRFMASIGNDHAGTLYPAALTAIDFILELARSDQPWVRVASLEVLRDCATSHVAEPGFELVEGLNQPDADLTSLVRLRITASGIDLGL